MGDQQEAKYNVSNINGSTMGNQEKAKYNVSNIIGGTIDNQQKAKYNVSNISGGTWLIRNNHNITLVTVKGEHGYSGKAKI